MYGDTAVLKVDGGGPGGFYCLEGVAGWLVEVWARDTGEWWGARLWRVCVEGAGG